MPTTTHNSIYSFGTKSGDFCRIAVKPQTRSELSEFPTSQTSPVASRIFCSLKQPPNRRWWLVGRTVYRVSRVTSLFSQRLRRAKRRAGAAWILESTGKESLILSPPSCSAIVPGASLSFFPSRLYSVPVYSVWRGFCQRRPTLLSRVMRPLLVSPFCLSCGCPVARAC